MSELYKLPAGWKWKKLGEVSKKIFAGGDKPDQVSEYSTKELPIPIYANGIKNDGLYGYSNVYKVYEECVTISARGTIGYSVVRNEKFLPIVRLIVVIPNLDLLSKFLKNYLDFEIVSNTGSSIPQLTVPAVKSIQIPLPPLAEQKRIVAKLDNLFEKIDKAIELHQQNITNANTLMASTLDKTFKKLEGECSKIALLDVMKISNKTLVPDDNQKYNYVGLENIEGNTGRLIDFCETQGKEIKSSKVEFKKGMVLYGKLRPYLNKVWFSEFDGVATTEILPFYPIDNTRLNMIFVKYYFLSSSYLQRVMRNCSGSRMPRLTTAFLKSEEAYIPLPPLPIQQQTVEYLDSIATKVDKIKQLNEQKLENLKALKASILDKAFRGEL